MGLRSGRSMEFYYPAIVMAYYRGGSLVDFLKNSSSGTLPQFNWTDLVLPVLHG
jgi:hypothetical protein